MKSSVRILREQSSLTGCQWQDDIADEIEEADARIAALERLVAAKDEALRAFANETNWQRTLGFNGDPMWDWRSRYDPIATAEAALDLKCEEVPG